MASSEYIACFSYEAVVIIVPNLYSRPIWWFGWHGKDSVSSLQPKPSQFLASSKTFLVSSLSLSTSLSSPYCYWRCQSTSLLPSSRNQLHSLDSIYGSSYLYVSFCFFFFCFSSAGPSSSSLVDLEKPISPTSVYPNPWYLRNFPVLLLPLQRTEGTYPDTFRRLRWISGNRIIGFPISGRRRERWIDTRLRFRIRVGYTVSLWGR